MNKCTVKCAVALTSAERLFSHGGGGHYDSGQGESEGADWLKWFVIDFETIGPPNISND